MKKLLSFLVIIMSLTFPVIAESFAVGVLNVFTDIPEAVIFVDGLEAGKETIVKLPLEVGEHYVQVKLDGRLVYAEKVGIFENRSTTVVSEHFVDIITKVPSRGAIDREVARVRESRGNIGLGFHTDINAITVVTAKWWVSDNLGLELGIAGEIPGSNQRGLINGRVYLALPQKIFQNNLLTGAVFAGIGIIEPGGNNSILQSNHRMEFGFSLETKLDKIANTLFLMKYSRPKGEHRSGKAVKAQKNKNRNRDGHKGGHKDEHKDEHNDEHKDEKKDRNDLLTDILALGILNLGYINLDVALQKEFNTPLQTVFGLGFTVYF